MSRRRGRAFVSSAAWIALCQLVVLAMSVAAAQDPLRAFLSDCGRKAQAAEQSKRMTVTGRNGWLFLAGELRHLSVGPFWGANAAKASRATDQRYADPLPAILDFKAQLDKANVALLLVPVPPKAIVYPDELSNTVPKAGAPPRFDAELQRFYALLRRSGVDVLDLTPDFLANRSGAHGAAYCRQDTHWSGKGCVLAAQRIAARIGTPAWLKRIRKTKYASEWQSVTISGDLREDLGSSAPPPERLNVRYVGIDKNVRQSPPAISRTSPVLLLGDSHTLVFHAGGDMLARGAGLADQLAFELGFAVDLLGVRGSGATPARISLYRQARSDPSYLKGKKLIIWCFAARDFTESAGWQKVPVSR